MDRFTKLIDPAGNEFLYAWNTTQTQDRLITEVTRPELLPGRDVNQYNWLAQQIGALSFPSGSQWPILQSFSLSRAPYLTFATVTSITR